MRIADLIRAAQEYDWEHRPRIDTWTRVPDSQVARLLVGAKLAREADNEQRQGILTPPDV